MAILTAAEIRARVSRGSPVLSESEFDDDWVEETRDLFMDALTAYKGVAYEPTTTVEKIRVSSYSNQLVLRWPKVTSVTSVVVNGTTIDSTAYEADESGVLYYFGGSFSPRYRATVTYVHGYATTPPAALQACALFVERVAAGDRSAATRDVSSQGYDGGGVTVYIRANADKGNLTAFADVNDLVAALPSYRPMFA